MPRQLRAGSFFYLHSKYYRCTSKRSFNPATLAGELTTVLLLIRSREIRGTSSVQLGEHPDGSSWMDRRVDKQITTGEENGKVRACFDPYIYIYIFFILLTLLFSDASRVLKNRKVSFYTWRTDQNHYVRLK